jgi:glycosyltransferase involved in cell wall biosynthesis
MNNIIDQEKKDYKCYLSIIIPCFNDIKTIERAVESALNQTYGCKEVIVVDDGSNFETKKVLDSFKSSIDSLIVQENKGPAAARNVGIEKADGKYIMVLDADDYFEPDFAEKAIQVLNNNSNIKLVTCYGKWFESQKDYKIHKPHGGDISTFMYECGAFGSSLFYRKDWKNVNGYDEEMKMGFEDWEFYIRLLKSGGKTHVIPEILFHYRKTENSRNSLANKKKYKIWEYIYLKHRELYIQDYNNLIRRFTSLLQQQQDQNNIIKNKPDFRLGYYLLLPLRKFKHLLRV